MREVSISPVSVESALASLKYTTKDTRAAHSLHGLALIDALIEQPTLPPSPLARAYALRTLLIDHITHELNASRRAHGQPPLHARPSRVQVQAAIAQDTATNTPQAIGWSLLYYLYVLADPDISQADYALYSTFEPRSVYRYKQAALQTLTYDLITREQAMRQQRQRQRLLARLPPLDSVPLIGREDELAHLDAALEASPYPCLVFSGPPGIGKSALLHAAARRLIEQGRVTWLFWVSSATSGGSVLEHIRDQLAAARLKSSFDDLTAAYPVLVVLDNTEQIDISAADWDELISQTLGRTITLAAGREMRLMTRAGLHLVVSELDEDAAARLVRALLQAASRDMSGMDVLTEAVWQQVGGHPQAIRLLIGTLEQPDFALFQAAVLDSLYHRLTEQTDAITKRLWDVLTLFPQGLTLEDLHSLTAGDLDPLMRLRQNGLLMVAWDERFVLTRSAALYRLPQRAAGMAWIQDVLESDAAGAWGWLAAAWLAQDERLTSHEALPLLHRYRPQMAADSLRWQPVLSRWAQWLDAPLQLTHLAVQPNADPERVRAVVQQAGRGGQFVLQAEALLLTSRLSRQRGDYQAALAALAHVGRIPRLPLPLQQQHIMAHLQIALDSAQADQVAQWVRQLTLTTPAADLLRLESAVLLRDTAAAESLAESLLRESPSEAAWVLTILGRHAHDTEQFAQAAEQFQAALIQFEQRQDVRAAARAQMNLAAALLALDQTLAAETLLTAAGETLTRLQDRVGLRALRANFDYSSRIDRLS